MKIQKKNGGGEGWVGGRVWSRGEDVNREVKLLAFVKLKKNVFFFCFFFFFFLGGGGRGEGGPVGGGGGSGWM